MRGRNARVTTQEELYLGGMQYRDSNVDPNFCRVLFNLDNVKDKYTLKPRHGYSVLANSRVNFDASTNPLRVHHSSRVQNTIGSHEDATYKYIMFYNELDSYEYYDADNLVCVIERGVIDGIPKLVEATVTKDESGEYLLKAGSLPNTGEVHSISYARDIKRPLWATLKNITYIPMLFTPTAGTQVSVLCMVRTQQLLDGGPYEIVLTPVDPKAVSTTEAINYGYNMLKEDPYTFEDSISAAIPSGYILFDGILPYTDEDCDELKFNARVGEEIVFRLFARYPNGTSTYVFRWEVRDVYSDSVTVYADQEDANAKVYNFDTTKENAEDASGNDYVMLKIAPPYQQFTVNLTAYESSAPTVPVQAISLASYTLAAAGSAIHNDLNMTEYDLTTATEYAPWNGHVALAGVESAKHILFVSDIHDPTYFPYPNQIMIFDEPIVKMAPCLEKLMVFTTNNLYKLSWGVEGMNYSKELIQDNIQLDVEDRQTLRVIKGMMFFRAGNYYYMIVPNTNSIEVGALQLAPISSNITMLLDNFEDSVKEILDTVYYFDNLDTDSVYTYDLVDYYNFIDGSKIRNCYKYSLKKDGVPISYFDLSLNYDTLSRMWNMYCYESNKQKLIPYRNSASSRTIMLNIFNTGTYPSIELAQADLSTPVDTFTLALGEETDGRRVKNLQYIDSGYKIYDIQVTKLFRNINISLSNTSREALLFGTEFIVDAETRKALYTYTTEVASEDPESSLFGQLVVSKALDVAEVSPGVSILDSAPPTMQDIEITSGDILQTALWSLGLSKLGVTDIDKVSIRVSGTGYSPRFKLLSLNQKNYEILSTSFVYRIKRER